MDDLEERDEFTSSTFNGTGGHIYEFRSRARDNVGNLEAYPGSADLTTEVRTIDMFVRNPGIEVNQAVQDLNNSVMLIANKRTFVRCYVQSDAGTINNVNARLRVYRGATLMGTLSPVQQRRADQHPHQSRSGAAEPRVSTSTCRPAG